MVITNRDGKRRSLVGWGKYGGSKLRPEASDLCGGDQIRTLVCKVFDNGLDTYMHYLGLLAYYPLLNAYFIGHVTGFHPCPYMEFFSNSRLFLPNYVQK